jgi:hypothetical protein
MFHSSYRRFSGLAITLVGALLLLGMMILPRGVTATPADPVTMAWQAARTAGSYHFTSDVTQVTLPLATLTNVGRTSRTEKLYLEGKNDLTSETMELTLWSEGGSVLQAESGVSIRSERGKTFARRGEGKWQEIDDFTGSLAPQGDFMSYLAAIQDVQPQPAEERGGVPFTRYTFTIDSPRFAVYLRQQMEAALRARGELPPGLHLDVPAYFRDMIGTGELWVGEDGLPLRQILTLQFPAQQDEQVQSQIVVDFSRFGREQPVSSEQSSVSSQWLATVPFSLLTDHFTPLAVLLPFLAIATLMLYFRRTRLLQTAIALLVIFAQVVGPLLSTHTNVKYFDAQSAKAAAQEERQATADQERDLRAALGTVEFNPHLNPLESGDERLEIGALPVESPQSLNLQSPNLQSTTDSGLDSDGDGLTDFAEERVGTDAKFADSDEDGLNDKLEVQGFTLTNDPTNRRWYANPLEADSNNDGLADALEWDNNGDNQVDDTDNDLQPDFFDADNDNDGVPDSKDSAPFAVATRSGGFDEANPFQLKLQNLNIGKPTFVDFQLRPQGANHLWFAFNVLDWPQDSQGQVRDVDGKSYADLAPATGSPAANNTPGDMKLAPMLEVRMPTASANLPPASDLLPYNITVNNYTADGATKIAYLPLSILTDEQTGQRVAFTARMRYLPTTAWNQAHEVRLVWLVQALVDVPCDHTDPQDVAAGCAADGYIHNVPQVIRSYYDAFTLTGLNVREDHGAGVAIIYEDARVDSNLKDDAALVALSHGLDNSFLAPRDQNKDGQRDVTLAEIARRFDRDSNSAVTATERWGLPNTLQVERRDYATGDQAVVSVAMTETTRILNSAFQSSWNADKTIQPLLLFAQEEQYRALGLDATRAGGNYATFSGTTLTLDMAPGGQPSIPTDTLASLKWMPYCAPEGTTPRWAPCELDSYWTGLEGRYGLNTPLPDYPNAPEVIAGNMVVLQLYFLSLIHGSTRAVLRNNGLVSNLYTLKSDSELEGLVRTATGAGGSLVKALTNTVVMARYVDKISILEYLGRQFREFRGGSIAQGLWNGPINIVRSFFSSGNINRLVATGIVLGVGAVLAGVATGAYFLVDSFLSSDPAQNLGAKIAIKVLVISITTYLSVLSPLKTALEWVKLVKSVGGSGSSVLAGSSQVLGSTRIASVVGTVIAVGITWGFFIYSMVANNVTAFSPTFNRALAETIASTIYLILLFVLSLTVIGTILVGIVAVIDAILTAICELGVDELRAVGGLDGACFTLGTAAVKGLAYAIYNYDLMINTDRSDLMVTGSPQVTLADKALGYAAGNVLTVTLPVTTTAVHKDPDPVNGLLIYPYLWLYSQESLKSSTFKYSLDRTLNVTPTAALDEMKDAWQDVREDHKFVLTPMYKGAASTTPSPLGGYALTAGLNRPIPFTLNMGFAIPAYECWGLLAVGVCYRREYTGGNHLPINSLFYDVFPATLDGFMSLTGSGDGGLRLGWDAAFPTLRDADGDGLFSAAYKGLDPNDASVDGDNDGLTDRYELEKRQAGFALSPIARDTDTDGLTDWQEMLLGSDPGVADTDNDGLKDGEEVYHQRYDPTTGAPTNTWEGGWEVTINAATFFVVRVSSDPFRADSDGDSISDQAERQLAGDANATNRVDNQNRPYHPRVPNTPPLAVFVATDDADGYLAPGQSFRYTSTVVANVPVAPGVLNVTAPSVLGGAINPLALGFNPLTFTATQTVTQAINLAVAGSGSPQGAARLTSTASTRLPNTGPGGWSFPFPINGEAPLGGLVAPAVAKFSAVTTSRPDRQDNYLLAALAIQDAGNLGPGDILAYSIPGGAVRAIENDNNNTTAFLHDTAPSMATNANGDTLAVWGQTRINVTVPISDIFGVIAGALLGPDGQIKRSLTFPTSLVPTTYARHNYGPVVASNGSTFLVAYESFAESSGGVTGRVQIVLQVFDQDGNPLNQNYFDAGSPQTGDVLARNSLALALASTGLNYQIVWQDRRAGSVYMAAVDANAQALLNERLVANSALTGADASYGPSLAFDPIRGRTLVVYLDATQKVVGTIYQGSIQVGALDPTISVLNHAASPKVVWHPGYRGWLLSFQSAADRSLTRLLAVDANGFEAFPRTYTLSDPKNDNSLACPAPQSYPAVDLRFEELPAPGGSPTTFTDASGYGNNATCTGTTCPAAGAVGAPNAPLSDYAVQFDGADDGLTINRVWPEDFTIAFWVKVTTPRPLQWLVDGRRELSSINGFDILLDAGKLVFGAAGAGIASSGRIDDGQWHFVTVTRQRLTGLTAAYLDGVQVYSEVGANVLLDGVTDLRIGKNRDGSAPLHGAIDHLQIYPTALAQDAVQAIYNRTNQSYCVAAGASGNQVYWAKVQASQPDVRGGRLSASNGLTLTIDSDLPTAQFTALPNNAVVGPGQVIGGAASDATSGVGLVEVSINNGPWTVANGANSWAFSLAGQNGAISLRVRATDNVGNVGNPSAAINLTVDGVAPALTINPLAATVKPTKNASGRWQVNLTGTASDASGIQPASLLVKLTQQSGVGVAQSEQQATLAGANWSLDYLLDASLADPTGAYTVTVAAEDIIGNRAAPVTRVLQLDATGPVATLSALDTARQVISRTIFLSGVVTDTNSIVGVEKVEIAYTPIEQVLRLPPGIVGSAAEPLLNRPWLPTDLIEYGAATSSWTVRIPDTLEGVYQIDLRAFDRLGNVSITSNVWRGTIDVRAPRLLMTGTVTGNSVFDAPTNTRYYEIKYLCRAEDWQINEPSFNCPNPYANRSFNNDPLLQSTFPSISLVVVMSSTWTIWSPTGTPIGSLSACDKAGLCASTVVESRSTVAAAETVVAATALSAPKAVILNPTADSALAVGDNLAVTVGAEAASGLKEVILWLDGAEVNRLSFAQSDNLPSVLRTLALAAPGDGPHTLAVQATDWAGGSQAQPFSVRFTLKSQPPMVTVDTTQLTVADSYGAGSNIYQLQGSVSDGTLDAVQVRVTGAQGTQAYASAPVKNGKWRIAYPVLDNRGAFSVTAQVRNATGQRGNVTQQVAVDRSGANPPETYLEETPSNPSNGPVAFHFKASGLGDAEVLAFECSLDDEPFAYCTNPQRYDNLSQGEHTFRVRGLDSSGFVDPTPAEFTWNALGSGEQVAIESGPALATGERTAHFQFKAVALAESDAFYECKLDSQPFNACTSPQQYSGLPDGKHSFAVRVKSKQGGQFGTPASYTWRITNVAPLAQNQAATTTNTTALAIFLNASDSDALTYQIRRQPSHGVLLGLAPELTYVAHTGFVGEDSFTFAANDDQSDSNEATVTIIVQPGAATLPDTTITDQPANPATSADASFSFSGSGGTGGIARFECSLDNAAFTTCTSPQMYSGLSNGLHTFAVRAVDGAGNTDATPASYTWSVQSLTVVATCGPITVYRNPQGNLVAPGWNGTIKLGSNGNNSLNGGSGRDLLLGLGGNDKLDGKGGDDLLCGGEGVDLLIGAAGNDDLDGGNGNDVLNGGAGDFDSLLAGEGNDVLLDGDGVINAQGGPGNDLFTLALRNGWRDENGQASFSGLTAGYDNDVVELAILNSAQFFVDISGDERDEPASPLEGNNDKLALAGVIAPASTIIKFEHQLVLSADAEVQIPSEEAGAEYLTEAVGETDETVDELSNQIFLPLINR